MARPLGDRGSRKYLLASLDQSLARMHLDYVDIFYSHRPDPETPFEETMGALDTAVRQGKALYAGISSYTAEQTREAHGILTSLGTPLLIHQPSYSMLNRWIEDGLLDVLGELGIGCIVFSPLAQGMLSDRYLHGIPEGSRATQHGSLSPEMLTDQTLAKIRALNEVAQRRGQTLAQMALAWTLRDPRVTSALVGASSVAQLDNSLDALENLVFRDDELAEIDRYASEGAINRAASSAGGSAEAVGDTAEPKRTLPTSSLGPRCRSRTSDPPHSGSSTFGRRSTSTTTSGRARRGGGAAARASRLAQILERSTILPPADPAPRISRRPRR